MKVENRKGKSLPKRIDNILQQFVEQSVKSYKPHIRKIILFGSYARGDFRSDSDIDLMVLVDYPREEVGDHMSELSDISFNISMVNDFIEINPVMQNAEFFDKWVRAYPFYNNVINEGVPLYEC
ncbi:MAG: nucleotidyltransferase domain-containing protein [Lachnospiraceae bacterium]|nr:nucleotidyltransferase domain-containing protein [Lachnospiraceae bacterium]